MFLVLFNWHCAVPARDEFVIESVQKLRSLYEDINHEAGDAEEFKRGLASLPPFQNNLRQETNPTSAQTNDSLYIPPGES